MTCQPKTVEDSRTTQVQILMPGDINGFDRLFGGQLMQWIDVVAAVVARRHSNANVTTVAVDNLQFKAAAYVNSTVVLDGRITHVGTTSMEVRVDTYVEEMDGTRKLVNRAYLVLVALDENEQPCAVPRLVCRTAEEQAEWDAGEKRRALRSQRRKEQY